MEIGRLIDESRMLKRHPYLHRVQCPGPRGKHISPPASTLTSERQSVRGKCQALHSSWPVIQQIRHAVHQRRRNSIQRTLEFEEGLRKLSDGELNKTLKGLKSHHGDHTVRRSPLALVQRPQVLQDSFRQHPSPAWGAPETPKIAEASTHAPHTSKRDIYGDNLTSNGSYGSGEGFAWTERPADWAWAYDVSRQRCTNPYKRQDGIVRRIIPPQMRLGAAPCTLATQCSLKDKFTFSSHRPCSPVAYACNASNDRFLRASGCI